MLLKTTLCVCLCGLLAAASMGQKKPSVIDEALAEQFPGCKIERVTCVLNAAQKKRAGKLASQKPLAKKTTFAYIARKDGKVVGTAFFDAHKVRTKNETLMVAVAPDGSLLGVETVAFHEPPEYIAQDSFYSSLEGRGQGRELQLGRGLDGTTGATLTCRAVADASRRVLALHEVLGAKAGRAAAEKRAPKKKPQKKAAEEKAKEEKAPAKKISTKEPKKGEAAKRQRGQEKAPRKKAARAKTSRAKTPPQGGPRKGDPRKDDPRKETPPNGGPPKDGAKHHDERS